MPSRWKKRMYVVVPAAGMMSAVLAAYMSVKWSGWGAWSERVPLTAPVVLLAQLSAPLAWVNAQLPEAGFSMSSWKRYDCHVPGGQNGASVAAGTAAAFRPGRAAA